MIAPNRTLGGGGSTKSQPVILPQCTAKPYREVSSFSNGKERFRFLCFPFNSASYLSEILGADVGQAASTTRSEWFVRRHIFLEYPGDLRVAKEKSEAGILFIFHAKSKPNRQDCSVWLSSVYQKLNRRVVGASRRYRHTSRFNFAHEVHYYLSSCSSVLLLS